MLEWVRAPWGGAGWGSRPQPENRTRVGSKALAGEGAEVEDHLAGAPRPSSAGWSVPGGCPGRSSWLVEGWSD
jgi:hypothetical protein